MKPNELPVYPTGDGYESRIFNQYNQLVAVVVGVGHFETACLICHLLNQAFGVAPNHYYPVVVPGVADQP